jgi:hypothetical protein
MMLFWGYDWLKQHSPIQPHWENKMMEFAYKTQLAISEVSIGSMLKWMAGNDV